MNNTKLKDPLLIYFFVIIGSLEHHGKLFGDGANKGDTNGDPIEAPLDEDVDNAAIIQ